MTRIVGGRRFVEPFEREQRIDGERRLDRRFALLALGQLGRGSGRLEAQRRRQLVLGEAGQQLGRRLVQKAGGELVQQAPDLLGGIDEQARLFVGAVADDLGSGERMLEQAREMGEVGEADRRRAAGQRVGERDRHFADRPMQLHRPFGDLGHQPARQLVGFVEVDVEERDADAQRSRRP